MCYSCLWSVFNSPQDGYDYLNRGGRELFVLSVCVSVCNSACGLSSLYAVNEANQFLCFVMQSSLGTVHSVVCMH